MNKLTMHTPYLADENFKKLAALFPNAVTETVNENGEVVRAIDKDVLMQEISTTVVEGREERYQFTWPDKKKAMLAANAPISATLRPIKADSVGKDGTPGDWDSENLYIEGDNFEVLKLLQETYLGKMGLVLHTFANGWDETPVSVEGYKAPIKSIGNSTTTPRDLVSELDVKIILMALSESVGARLRENGFQCRTVEISIRDNGLYHFTRQCKLDRASNLTEEIARTAFELFQKNYNWEHPIRSLGVRGCDLVSEEMPYQLDLFMDETKREKIKKMDQVVDEIRGRFGYQSIQRAFMYQDKVLSSLDAQKSHTVHPVGYFNGR